ncbi:MAG: DeoR/GlpR family DNA-binding transcription regulator [Pseudomonadota bacterium]
MPRNKIERHRRILAELEQRPSLRVTELAGRLDVSAETIRRDLDELTGQRLIDRTYGGAVRRLSLEPSVNERHALRVAERKAIAEAALPHLAGATHLLIGSGATTVHVARRIAVEMNDVTVLTHAFGVATVLSLNPTITVIVLPGVYHPGEGAMHGSATLRFLDGVRVDWAVLGASGLTEDGPSDALLEAGDVYAAMAARATQSMVVADASKFGRRFPACWAGWGAVDRLVSDAAPPAPLAKALEAAEVGVTLARDATA